MTNEELRLRFRKRLDVFFPERWGMKYSDLIKTVFVDDRYALEERAAIHEYEGKLPRAEAEERAVKEYYEKLDEEGFRALVEVMNEPNS